MLHKHLDLNSSKCSDVSTDSTVDELNTSKENAKDYLSLSLPIPKTPTRPAPAPCLHLGQLWVSVL